jgi:hypothetical protein
MLEGAEDIRRHGRRVAQAKTKSSRRPHVLIILLLHFASSPSDMPPRLPWPASPVPACKSLYQICNDMALAARRKLTFDDIIQLCAGKALAESGEKRIAEIVLLMV